MRETDLAEFSGMLDAVCSMLSRGNYTPSAPNTAMWFRSLAQHDIAAIRAGFDAHVKNPQRGRFVPVPADIIAQIEGMVAEDGRLGPEEAWACAMRSADESNTIVWTDEMSQAWAVVVPVLYGGDQVGARMAFKEAYVRMVDESRRARRAPVWTASLGFDASKRDEALQAAAKAGRIAAPELLALPAPEQAFEAIAGNAKAPAGIREQLIALRNRFARRDEGPSPDVIGKQRTEALKAETAQRVSEFGRPA